MIHLLAYLLIRMGDGQWKLVSHRTLEGLLSDWFAVRESDINASAVVHVGFWRPDSVSFDSICREHPGRVLLTGSVKWALPRNFLSSSRPSALLEELPIYLGLSGWGYEIDESTDNEEPTGTATCTQGPAIGTSAVPRDWLVGLERSDPELFEACSTLGVLSETLYQERENRLPPNVRDRLGVYRFKALTGFAPSSENMIDQLAAAPPWLLCVAIDDLYLTVRADNCLAGVQVKMVSDLAPLGTTGLLKIRALGRKTVSDISDSIFRAFRFGSAYCDARAIRRSRIPEAPEPSAPIVSAVADAEPNPSIMPAEPDTPLSRHHEPQSFREALDEALGLVTEQEAWVLRQRMGIGGSRKTLEEIANSTSLTRERIRQIEDKAVSRIVCQMPVWTERFRKGIGAILEGRTEPLPLLGLDVIDQWFVGANTLAGPFDYALRNFVDTSEFNVLRISDQAYVSRLKETEWRNVERASAALLSHLAKKKPPPTEKEVKLLIVSQLVGPGEELRSLLWQTIRQSTNFSEDENGESVLVSYGMGAESMIRKILSDSDRPLHYLEIAKQCAMKGRPFDVRQALNAAAQVGYLLGRGTYGLPKHIDLSKEEQAIVIEAVNEMISGTPEKQWHAEEICDELDARGLDFGGRLSKYDLNVILDSSTDLVYLRRMVWTSKTKWSAAASDRLNIWQAVVALVQQHGSPMCASDIREILSRDRGLPATFQIHQADPLIRVGDNEWGILWRDIPFDVKKANEIVDEMVQVLMRRGFGLHKAEIVSALEVNREVVENVHPVLLVALGLRSNKVKSGKGGYVYLPEWEGTRRFTVREAVQRAFADLGDGVLAADVAKRASELLGRPIPNNTASSALMHIGTYDKEKGLWFRTEMDSGDFDELEDFIG